MADHDYMANPDAEFFDNLNNGEGLSGEALHQVAESWSALKGKIADRVGRLRLVLSEGNLGQVGTSEDWWTGTGGDAHREELTQYSNYVEAQQGDLAKYEGHIKDLADGTAEAKSTTGQPMGALFGSGSNPAETTRAVARATQKLYYNPGTPVAEELHYPGQTPETTTPDDFTAPPKGSGQSQPSTGGASSGGAPAGGASQHEPAASPVAATPQQNDAASSQQPEAQAEGKPSGAGSGGSGAGSGGGSGSGDGGKGSGAGGGSPFGGTPAAGTPSSGSGFDSSESGATHAMSAGDSTFGSSSGGSGLGGGVGTLGGDHERALSAKSGPGSIMGSKPVVNVNGLAGSGVGQGAGMGGGMGGMGAGAGGQGSGKEHKTPDYLKGEDNGQELFGGNLPVVIPEVIGELTEEEYRKMREAEADRREAAGGA